jgi:hypothetical protein
MVGATMRTVPFREVPSAAASSTFWPALMRDSCDSGISARHSTRSWRSKRSISWPDCAICPTLTVREVTVPSSGATTVA